MGGRGAQKGLLLGSVKPLPIINTQTTKFVNELQGPIVVKLGDIYSALPFLVMPLLVLSGTGSVKAALITSVCIAALSPFAVLKLFGIIK